jgi:L-lactate dehydrogenase
MENKNIDEILLINRTMETSEGIYLELSSAFPEYAHKLKVAYFEDAKDADIVVIASGIPQFPLQKRIELLKINEKIVNEVFDMIKLKDTAVLLVITNPVDIITYIAWKRSGLKPSQVIGFGGYLDTNRLKYLISKETGKDPSRIDCYVIGEHGEEQIPIFREDVLNREEIIYGVRNYIQDVISKIGASKFAPAKLVCNMVDSIIKDEKKIFCVSHYDKERGMFITWPCVIGRSGITKVFDLKLTEQESSEFNKLIEGRKKYISSIPMLSKRTYLNLVWKADSENTNKNELAVVVDILRAGTSITNALSNGANSIMPVVGVEDAFKLKKKYKDALVAGERQNLKVSGFDIGNSPYEFSKENVRGKDIIFTSTDFPKAIFNAKESPVILVGSMLNVTALANKAYKIAEERNLDICLVLCEQSCEPYAKEELTFAGVFGNVLKDKCELSGKMKTAINFVKENGMNGCLNNSGHAKELIESGLDEDVKFACQKDMTDTIGILKKVGSEYRIVSL